MGVTEDTNIKYQVQACNEIILNSLIRLKGAGFDDDQIKILLNCIGKTYLKYSCSDTSIEQIITHVREYMLEKDWW